MEKKCSKCGQTKDFDQFCKYGNNQHRTKSGYRAYCKACANEYQKNYHNTTAKGICSRLRALAHQQSIPCNITSGDFVKWWANQKLECHYCLQRLTRSLNRTHKLSDMTFDRKDSSKGYSLENIVLSCRRCNLMKGNWLTEQQTIEIAQKYFKF